MKINNIPNHHSGNQQAPRRVASRMEGSVKNFGSRNQKKQAKK
jgi:hypothetical protein